MSDKATYIKEAKKLAADGKNKGQIEGYLKFTYDLSTKDVKDIVAEVMPQSGVGHADWTATVKFLRENVDKLTKKELIDGMCEVNGKTYLTNQHAYNYVAMAQEWASQEVTK